MSKRKGRANGEGTIYEYPKDSGMLREHRFGFVKREPEGVGRERLTLQAGNLVHDGRLVVAFNHHLYPRRKLP